MPPTTDASRPSDLGKSDLKAALRRTKQEVKRDNLSLIAAGVAFYAFLAIFPALTAVVSLYGLLADPAQVEQQVQALSGVIPGQAQDIIQSQLQRVTAASSGALGLGAVLSLLFAVWSANKATKGMFQALSLVYGEKEERGFLRMNWQSLLMTLALVVTAVIALGLVAVFPAVIGWVGLGSATETIVSLARWPVLVGVVLLALAALYEFAPDRERPRWRWVSPGALLATALWLIASIAFSIYVQNFGNYNQTYGVLGAVVVLLLWTYISVFVILIGGELNAELERQTTRDTTRGEPKPMGERGAYVADTVPQ